MSVATLPPVHLRWTQEAIRDMQDRRRSGASGTHHDRRTARSRARSANRQRAIKESLNDQ